MDLRSALSPRTPSALVSREQIANTAGVIVASSESECLGFSLDLVDNDKEAAETRTSNEKHPK